MGGKNFTLFYILNDVMKSATVNVHWSTFSRLSVIPQVTVWHIGYMLWTPSLGWLGSARGRDMLLLTLVLVTSVIAFPSASFSVKRGEGHRMV